MFIGAGDGDFLDVARRAADEIPKGELVTLETTTPPIRARTRWCSKPCGRWERTPDSSPAFLQRDR